MLLAYENLPNKRLSQVALLHALVARATSLNVAYSFKQAFYERNTR